jgi:outer membrane protein
VLFIGAAAGIVIKQLTEPKTGYVMISEIYDAFEMKKEMEKKYLQVKNYRDKVLDSLEQELKILASSIERRKNKTAIEEFSEKRDAYIERKKTYDEDNQALTKKYDQQILTRLNQYIRDYGAQQGYAYIFGNDAGGSLMFVSDERNITKEVTVFINSKYHNE